MNILISILFSFSLLAHTGFLPENNLQIPVEQKLRGGLSEAEFKEVVMGLYTLYYPIIKNQGGDFYIDGKWKDAGVNAYAEMRGPLRKITVLGGMGRHPVMTKDALALIICHEVGHFLGGAPKNPTDSWASVEGEADYFASLKCVRRLWLSDDNEKIVMAQTLPDYLKKSCETQKLSKADEFICLRTGIASLSIAKLLASMTRSEVIPQFETPDEKKVTQTNISYPSAQCRIDTFFAGLLCEKSFQEDLSDVDEIRGACHSQNGDKIGVRPACWYKARGR